MKHEYSRSDIERYLLGKGSEEERSRIAEALIVDAEFHNLVAEIETEQVDALAQGKLQGEQAAAWHDFLVQTGQLERLVVAHAIASKMQPRRSAMWRLAIAAALLLSLGGAWWWRAMEKPQEPVVMARRVSVVLPRDITRGTSREIQVTIARDVGEVELRFEVAPEPASGYRVRILDGAGRTILTRSGDGWPTGFLAIVLPASELPAGRVDLELSSLDGEGKASPVGFQQIRVMRLKD